MLHSCVLRVSIGATCQDESWVSLDGDYNCYKVVDEAQTWDEANDHCTSIRAHLLTLETAGEATVLANYITELDNKGNGEEMS